MTAPVKPVDLTDARRVALASQYAGKATAAKTIQAMANEIEALRAGLTSAIGVAESCDGAGLFTATLARLRALLPPT